jgi:hypothetical protein
MAKEMANPLGYAQLTVSTTAVQLSNVPAAAVGCLIVLNATNGVRWRDDGQNPTAAVGMLLAGGGTLDYRGTPSRLRFIREGAADAVVNVSYYGA